MRFTSRHPVSLMRFFREHELWSLSLITPKPAFGQSKVFYIWPLVLVWPHLCLGINRVLCARHSALSRLTFVPTSANHFKVTAVGSQIRTHDRTHTQTPYQKPYGYIELNASGLDIKDSTCYKTLYIFYRDQSMGDCTFKVLSNNPSIAFKLSPTFARWNSVEFLRGNWLYIKCLMI